MDIITVDGETSADPELTLPHPRAHERAFVLAPWLELDPDAVLPGSGSGSAAAGSGRHRPECGGDPTSGSRFPVRPCPQAGRAEADLPCR